jgi:hypothetical protein
MSTPQQASKWTIVAGALIVGLIIGGLGIYLAVPGASATTNNTTLTQTFTVTQLTTIVTQATGSRPLIASTVEVIPKGDNTLTLNLGYLAYDGNLIITYVASDSVSISYSVGDVTITTPNAETQTSFMTPVDSGSPQITITNGACGLLGCPAITLTLTIGYSY